SLRAMRSPRAWSTPQRLRRCPQRAFAQPGQRLADEPGDLHLRDADALGDLRLGQILHEAEVQDAAVALVEHVAQRAQRGDLLGALDALVLVADGVAQR